VARRRAGAGLALAVVALSAAGCGIGGGGTKTVTVTRTQTVTKTRTITVTTTSGANTTAACTGDQLSSTFTFIPGSSGAGQTSYALKLANTSASSCHLFGVPQVQLLARNGTLLPTHVVLAQGSGIISATLAPGATTSVQARFSPTVPGKGDAQNGPCQPKAYTMQLTPGGGGTSNAPIKPPTSVCERGTLNFEALPTP